MVKPIELDELLLRVRALLRRANIEMERKITVGNLILDADAMSAEIDGEEISLTTREFNIIYKLLSYSKKTFFQSAAHGRVLGCGDRYQSEGCGCLCYKTQR